jgi:hypothetical protein
MQQLDTIKHRITSYLNAPIFTPTAATVHNITKTWTAHHAEVSQLKFPTENH